MAQSSPRISDDIDSDEERDYGLQNDHPRQEFIPLRDHSPHEAAQPRSLKPQMRTSENESGRRRRKIMDEGVTGELQRHTLGIWLLILYASIAILSWSITCVLSYQPIGIRTYFDQIGNYSRSDYERSAGLRRAADVGSQIVAAIGIPVTSSICAKAAAVYCQSYSDATAPPLTLRQMMALADKGWSIGAAFWDVLRPSTGRRTRSPLLILSSVLVGIGA